MEEEEEGVSSYLMILRGREDSVKRKGEKLIALCGELVLEKAMDLSYGNGIYE